jgi:hypothetical protein
VEDLIQKAALRAARMVFRMTVIRILVPSERFIDGRRDSALVLRIGGAIRRTIQVSKSVSQSRENRAMEKCAGKIRSRRADLLQAAVMGGARFAHEDNSRKIAENVRLQSWSYREGERCGAANIGY